MVTEQEFIDFTRSVVLKYMPDELDAFDLTAMELGDELFKKNLIASGKAAPGEFEFAGHGDLHGVIGFVPLLNGSFGAMKKLAHTLGAAREGADARNAVLALWWEQLVAAGMSDATATAIVRGSGDAFLRLLL